MPEARINTGFRHFSPVVRHSLTFSRGNELDSYQKSNMNSKIAYLLSFFPIHSQSRMLYFQCFYIKKDPIESAFTLLQGLLLNLFYLIFRASTHCLFTIWVVARRYGDLLPCPFSISRLSPKLQGLNLPHVAYNFQKKVLLGKRKNEIDMLKYIIFLIKKLFKISHQIHLQHLILLAFCKYQTGTYSPVF